MAILVYVDDPPFAVRRGESRWVGACARCHGVHVLLELSYACCSNRMCESVGEVIPFSAEAQAPMISALLLGGVHALALYLEEWEPDAG